MTEWKRRRDRRDNLAAQLEFGVSEMSGQDMYRKRPQEVPAEPWKPVTDPKAKDLSKGRVRPSERHTVGGVVTAEDIMRGIGVTGE